jgi:uncharacterized protein (TIGR00369 family)
VTVPAELEQLVAAGQRLFPGVVGLEFVDLAHGSARASLELRDTHRAPNGYLHAGVVVTLADTVCGYGCIASLPQAASSFTTIELKANFVAAARGDSLACDGRLVHGGRTTQVWDAVVTDRRDAQVALFRCTQLLLYSE